MSRLSRTQTKLLKKILKLKTINCSDISDSELKVYKFLDTLGYVKITYRMKANPYSSDLKLVPTTPISISIHEAGKAYLYERKFEDRRWRITTALSVLALITAIAAIVLSPFFNAFFTRLYGL